MQIQPLGKTAAHQRSSGVIVRRPLARDLPRGVQLFQPRDEHFGFVHGQGFLKPTSHHHHRLAFERCGHIEKRREGHNVVPPENPFQTHQRRFRQERSSARRPVIDAAHGHGKAVRSRSDGKVRAEGAQFAADLVTHVERQGGDGRRDGDAEGDGENAQQLAAPPAGERFPNDSKDHATLSGNTWRRRPAPSAAMCSLSPSIR